MADTTFEQEIDEKHRELANEDGDFLDDLDEIEGEVDETDEPEETEQEESSDGEEAEETEEVVSETEEEDLLAPHTWPGEWKETFTKLPADAKKVMLRMNSDMVNGFSQKMGQLGRMKRELDGLQKSVQPHMDRLQRAGISPEIAIQRALQWDAYIEQNGAKGLMEYAKAKGLDPGQLSQTGQEEYLTPTERQMKQELDSLRQAHQQMQQFVQHQNQTTQQQSLAQRAAHANRVLHDFVNEKNPDGKPAHPLVSNESTAPLVAPFMADLIQTGKARDLKQAYDMAVWAIPETRQILERQRSKANSEANKRKVDSVRRASKAGITSKSPGKQKSDTWDDEVDALLRKQSA